MKKRIKQAAGGMLMLALTGCAGYNHYWDEPLKTQDDKDDFACRQYFLYPQTELYAKCRQRLAAGRDKATTEASPSLPGSTQSPNVICNANGAATNCQSR